MLGVGSTVNAAPLLATPLTVTTTLPVVAPAGTGATMLVADQLVGVAVVPLNFTVLVPCVAPKLVPVIVMDTPTAPLVGASDVMVGAGSTVDRKSTRLNSSHVAISYAVFCLKKKNINIY